MKGIYEIRPGPAVVEYHPKGYYREMPEGIVDPRLREDLTRLLPWQLQQRGCELIQIEEFAGGGDPLVLYDAWGNILGVWEQEPSLGDLLEFC